MLGHTGCRAVVVSANYAAELDGMCDRIPSLEHVLVRGDDYERELASFPATDPDPHIISGGFNIWPAELENVLMEHPAVLEAVAFGVPDERWGEVPYAHVQVESAGAVAEQELIARCTERLGSYKKPEAVELQTTELMKSPVGKLLREPYWAGQDRRVSGS